MRRVYFFFLFFLCALSSVGLALGAIGVLEDAAATTYAESLVRFQGEPAPLKVDFLQAPEGAAGVTVSSLDGHVVARISSEVRGLLDGTGAYDVTGDGWPEIIMYGWVGAKTNSLRIYAFHGGKLQKALDWTGFSYQLVRLDGRPVVALTQYQYGALTELYVWRNGKFQKVNHDFPQFYRREIAEAESFLGGSRYFGAGTTAQACHTAAQGLVYGAHYDEATKVCERALKIVDAHLHAPPKGEDYQSRLNAEHDIRHTLDAVARARRQASHDLTK